MNESNNRPDHPLVEDYLGKRARVYGAERAILVGLQSPSDEGELDSLHELGALADTAGVPTLAQVIQRRKSPDSATFIGKGKVAEVKEAAKKLNADVIIFNDELSAAQARNLEEAIGKKVIDRTQLIMDIFAQRAATKEAKLQVELAQLRYLLPRLRGWGNALTRLGGGIGTRGPGETQLELDRKKINRRIHTIERRLVGAKRERALQQKKRLSSPLSKIVLVGYTNSGKSTLLNTLCDSAEVLVEDKLFATLSTTVRRGGLGAGRYALFIDTVGFIRDLPHHLIPAFTATLEAVRDADLILHIIDLASPTYDEDFRAVLETLDREIFTTEGTRPPILNVLNKVDATNGAATLFHPGVQISAKKGLYIDELRQRICATLDQSKIEAVLLVSYTEGESLHQLIEHGGGRIIGYTEEGIKIAACLSVEALGQIKKAGVRIIACPSSRQEESSPKQHRPRSAPGRR